MSFAKTLPSDLHARPRWGFWKGRIVRPEPVERLGLL
jgi:hypothetical protein